MVVVHNGIIVNSADLWKKNKQLVKNTNLDSELIPSLISHYRKVDQGNLAEAVRKMYKDIYGMTSTAIYFDNIEMLLLATNNGSLYYAIDPREGILIFGSERLILQTVIDKTKLNFFNTSSINQIPSKSQVHFKFDLNYEIIFGDEKPFMQVGNQKPIEITENKSPVTDKDVILNQSMEHYLVSVPEKLLSHVKVCKSDIASIIRCTKCLLPETFPFIAYDDKGKCNYCSSYEPMKLFGAKAFKKEVQSYKSKSKGNHDCLLPLSGGRDSCYTLHYVKEELGMNTIAFSYDWGMLTDLARRNQSRMCGKLGVEHILISADIRKKRKNINKNVTAWLKKPHLGTIPLFMAGDKQYFYYANLLMEQNFLKLSIMGENMLETTRFKSGFAGISPKFDTDHTYTLSKSDKLKMLWFYGKEFLTNPAYFNSSLLDTLDAFKSYYIIKHKNVNIFDYVPWIEKEIESVLINNYDWETDPGTRSTWRIGDGTAAFYNYIYYVVAGFTENDTFRSNQIREGLISREEAIKKIAEENSPRWNSIQWYCRTIGIDWEKALRIINKIPKRY